MISDKIQANRLRRHRELKALTEARLELTVSDHDKKHLKARIAEIDRDIVATKGDSIEEGDIQPIPMPISEKEYVEAQLAKIADREMLERVTPREPKHLLSAITETAEEGAKIMQPHKTKRSRKKKVGNPF